MNILQRLNAVMAKVDYVQKEKKAGMRYSIVSHDAVTAKVRPLLQEQGIVYWPVKRERTQDGNRTHIDLTVRFANMDDPSDFIDVETSGYGIDDQDKGPGKALSYAVKYALLKALGLETGDDPDEDQDAKHKPAAASAARQEALDFLEGMQVMLAECKKIDTLKQVWNSNKAQLVAAGELCPDEAKELLAFYKERGAKIMKEFEATTP